MADKQEELMGYAENRPLFDWAIFLTIYVILIAAITYAAVNVYGPELGWWVSGSAAVAGLVGLYLFRIEVERETGYKIVLAIFMSANAAWLVHNGAFSVGTKEFNEAQIRKYKAGMEEARKARNVKDRNALSQSAAAAAQLEKLFAGDMATVAAVLAFFELVSALIVFADATSQARHYQRRMRLMVVGTPGAVPVQEPATAGK